MSLYVYFFAISAFLGCFSHASRGNFTLSESQKANRDECLKANNLEINDIVEMFKQNRKDASQLTEPELCFFKCLHEKDGNIDGNGKLNVENFLKTQSMIGLNSEKMQELEPCLKKIDKIETCMDMTQINKCFMPLTAP